MLGVARFDIVGVRMSSWLDANDVDADATGTVGLIVALTLTLTLAIDGTN